MAWEATEEAVPVSGGKWTEEQPTTWLGRAGQTAVDLATAAGHAATFGMDVRRDALSGWLAGDYPSYSAGVESEQKKLEKQRERSPYASIAGDVAGAALIPGMGGAGLGARLGGGLAARAAGYGLEGAAIGAAQGVGSTYSGKPLDYAGNALVGGGVGGVLGAGMGSVFGPRGGMRSSAEVPDAATQGRARDAAYEALRQHPAQYTLPGFAGRALDIENQLRMVRNAHEMTSPQSFRTVGQMHNPPTAAAVGRQYVTPGDIDFVRKGVTGDEFRGMTPTDQGSAGFVRRGIDEFIRNPPPGAAVPGTEHLAADAARTANTAHALHAGTKRTEAMEELIRNAERQAGSTYSGLNLRNELQKAVKGGLKEKAGDSSFSKAGFNANELAAFDRYSRGQGSISRGLGYVDKYLGGGGGLGALVAGGVGGHYLGGDNNSGLAYGLGTSAAGLGLRMLGNRRAARDINELREMISRRNPLYQQRAATAPMVPPPGGGVPASVRDAMTLELLRQQGVSREE